MDNKIIEILRHEIQCNLCEICVYEDEFPCTDACSICVESHDSFKLSKAKAKEIWEKIKQEINNNERFKA